MKLKTTLLICLTALFTYQIQAQCTGAQFQEVNGIAVIEAESVDGPGWAQRSSQSGFTGNGYNSYEGTNYFGSPGNNVVTYTVRINTPGTYRFQWRNKIGVLANSNPSTEHNDSWVKFPDASDFYGQRGNSRIYPGGSGKSPTPNGASSGGWFKVYTNTINWSWSTQTSDFDPHNVFAVFNSPGVYRIQVSGRSNGHLIDRMVLHRTSYSGNPQNLGLAQTNCGGGSPPPPPPPPPPSGNNAPTVSITNPSNGQSFNIGSNITVGLSANDSDGSITKHQIFVNNVLVDTDGSNYSAYRMTNLAAGSYAIRATVTDNGGKTASATVNITVGGGGNPPPPPPPPPSGGNNAPTVSITNPNNGQNFNAGSTVTVGVSASDSDGSIVKHQVYVNNILKDTDGTNYTAYQIANIAAGSYAIRVTVTDNDGATASATANITVGSGNPPPPPPPPTGGNNAPTVSITNPNNGQNFAAGSNVSIGLSASDSDGTVVKYQIFVNNVLRDTDGAFFTPYVINNIAAGSYAIRGTVTDNDGATASATVNITVGSGNPPPPPPPPSGGGVTFSLINAANNSVVSTLSNGGNISSPTNKNIRANSSFNGTKSVYFRLSGRLNRVWTENAAPYALYADNGGNYVGVNFPSGSYTLLAEAWSGSNRTGTKLGSATINFTAGTTTAKSAIGQVYVYPNPIKNGRFSVKVPEEVVGDVYYRLISTSGAEVETGKISVERAGDNAEFNLDSFDNKNNGVYYLILQSKGSSYTVPLIKK